MTTTYTQDLIGKEDLKYGNGTFNRTNYTGAGTVAITKLSYGYEVVNANDYGAVFTSATLQAAITAIGATNKTLYLAPGTWVITANLTFPATMHVLFDIGTIFQIATGIMVTINGPMDAPLSQIFDYTDATNQVDFRSNNHITEFYPEWWGITGTADEVAINKAIISIIEIQGTETGGGIVKFASKTYNTTSPINIIGTSQYYRGKIHLIGCGESTIINSTSTTDIIHVEGFSDYKNLYDIRIKNMQIHGNYSAPYTQVGIYMKNAMMNCPSIEECFVHGCQDKQIFLDHQYYTAIKNCTVGGSLVGKYGIYVENSNSTHIEHCYAHALKGSTLTEDGNSYTDGSIGTDTVGFYVDGSDCTSIINCRAESCGGAGFKIGQNGPDEGGGVSIISCGVEDLRSDPNYFAIIGSNDPTVPARNIHIIACEIMASVIANQSYGLYIDSADGVTVTDCEFNAGTNVWDAGEIWCTANAKNVVLGHNRYRTQYPYIIIPVYSVNPDTIYESNIPPIWVPAKEFYDMNIAESTAPTAATLISNVTSQGVEWLQFPDNAISTAAANIALPGNWPPQRELGGIAYWAAAATGNAIWSFGLDKVSENGDIRRGNKIASYVIAASATPYGLVVTPLDKGTSVSTPAWRINGKITGTHTAAGTSATVLTDSTKLWVTNDFAGMSIKNDTENATATIVSNTANTITSGALSGGKLWHQNDTYTLSGNFCKPHDMVRITVRRGATNVLDTIDDVVGLIGVMIYPVYHPIP